MSMMKSSARSLATAALSFALLSHSHFAFSAESKESASNLSVNDQKVTAESKTQSPFHMDYFGTYHGSPVKDLGSSRGVDNKGKVSKGSIYLDSEVTAAYMVTPTIGVGPVVPFLLIPEKGQGALLGDVGLKAFNRKTITFNGFNLSTNLILQAPTSDSSKKRNMDYAIKTTPNFSYNVPDSSFTLGAWTELKAYMGVTVDKTFKLYAAPYVKYQLTPKLALNLEYEMESHHNVGQRSLEFTTYQTDFEPGVIWNVTPNIMVNPYLQIFTTEKVSMNNTAVGAILVIR